MPNPIKPVASVRGVPLASGHAIEVDARESVLRISNPEGRVELTVRCTDRGCVLEFNSAELALTAPGKLSLDCEELAIRTQRSLELSSEGDCVSRVGGSSLTQVRGRSELRAEELELVATRGDAAMRANDHVKLVGEKVLLNSEQQGQTLEELEQFWKSFGA